MHIRPPQESPCLLRLQRGNSPLRLQHFPRTAIDFPANVKHQFWLYRHGVTPGFALIAPLRSFRSLQDSCGMDFSLFPRHTGMAESAIDQQIATGEDDWSVRYRAFSMGDAAALAESAAARAGTRAHAYHPRPPCQTVLPHRAMPVRKIRASAQLLFQLVIAKLRLLQVPQLGRNARRRIPGHRRQLRQRQPGSALVRAEHHVPQHLPLRPWPPSGTPSLLSFPPHIPSSFLTLLLTSQEIPYGRLLAGRLLRIRLVLFRPRSAVRVLVIPRAGAASTQLC